MWDFLCKIRVAILGRTEADVLYSLMGGYILIGMMFLIYAAGVE